MELLEFVRVIVTGTLDEGAASLAARPELATMALASGATRGEAKAFFFDEIKHYVYRGDTALHVAAAAFRRDVASLLVRHGADVHARNRLGAAPLHYAADTNHRDPNAQADTIAYLLSCGANVNLADRRGTMPLHRAVRTRSRAAVQALLDGGADVAAPNGSGSTPLHLALQTTGRGGSGTTEAKAEQEQIIGLLLARGARLS